MTVKLVNLTPKSAMTEAEIAGLRADFEEVLAAAEQGTITAVTFQATGPNYSNLGGLQSGEFNFQQHLGALRHHMVLFEAVYVLDDFWFSEDEGT